MDILKKLILKNIFVLIVISFALISSFSLFHSGLPPTHDGEYHVIRFYEFDKALRDGNIYPRWAADLNNGFGLPLFNYVYPLPNYMASFFHFFGISFIDSFKLNMIFAVLIGAIFFYLWSRQFWGNLGGLVSSVFYTFSPYHFVDLYIRGSVGEVWALGFFPAFLWAITNYLRNKKLKFFLLSAIFLSLIIFSHNILALMFFPFAISYIVFLILNQKEKKRLILDTCYIILIGLGLSSIFWVPALLEIKYVTGLQVFGTSYHFPEFYELIIPSWGSGFSGDLRNHLSFQIGVANLLALFISILILLFTKKNENKRYILFFILSFFLIFFLMLKISLPIWQKVPFMNYFQFPWRFLSLEILFASFLAGSFVVFSKKIIKKVLAILMIILAVSLGLGYAKPAYYLERNDSYYTTKSNFIDGTNSPGNAFNTIFWKAHQKAKEKVSFEGDGTVQIAAIKSSNYIFSVNAKEDGNILVNTAYFPGWTAYIDGKYKEVKRGEDGLFYFPVGRGNHRIVVKLEDTDIRKLASAISLFSILALFICMNFVKIKR